MKIMKELRFEPFLQVLLPLQLNNFVPIVVVYFGQTITPLELNLKPD